MSKLYNFYKVTAKCGHVGKYYCVLIDFPIKATNGVEASNIARSMPRVKHDHKDAILSCEKITKEEYELLLEVNSNDPYLQCKSVQDQKYSCDMDGRIIPDTYYDEYKEEGRKYGHFDREERLAYKNKVRRIKEESMLFNQYDYAM